jgi:nitroreductase
METWDAIRARRNVRTFTDRAISEPDLGRILEAAWRTPSSSNRQRWEFIACTERAQLAELAKVWRGAGHVAGSAATIALICPIGEDERTRVSINYDLGQATMSIMFAAADLGIGSCHSAVTEYDLAREILGLPEDRQCAWLISLGYPADRPLRPIRKPNRRPFEEVVRRGRW